jgi:DNA-binding response OmpR family regulator
VVRRWGASNRRSGHTSVRDAKCDNQQMVEPIVVESENEFYAGPGTMSLEAVVVFEDGTLLVDFARRETILDGEPIILTPKEYGLLAGLVRDYGKALSSDKLLELVRASGGAPNVCWLSVVHVRRTIEWLAPIVPIQNGYRHRSRSNEWSSTARHFRDPLNPWRQ